MAKDIAFDYDRIHPESDFAKHVFPDEWNSRVSCFSLLHRYNYRDANAAGGRDASEAARSKRREFRSLLDLRRELSMDYGDPGGKHASFPKTGAVDGSGSCRTFIALSCNKRISLVHKILPCGDKKPGQENGNKRRKA